MVARVGTGGSKHPEWPSPLCLGLPSVLFYSWFFLTTYLWSIPCLPHALPITSSLELISLIIFRRVSQFSLPKMEAASLVDTLVYFCHTTVFVVTLAAHSAVHFSASRAFLNPYVTCSSHTCSSMDWVYYSLILTFFQLDTILFSFQTPPLSSSHYSCPSSQPLFVLDG